MTRLRRLTPTICAFHLGFSLDTTSQATDQFPTKIHLKTLAQQKLVFDYMIRFKRIRNQEETGWLARSREWERRLS